MVGPRITRREAVALAAVLAGSLIAADAVAAIMLNPGGETSEVSSIARNYATSNVDKDFPAALPFSSTTSATFSQDTSTATHNLSPALLMIDFTHSGLTPGRNGTQARERSESAGKIVIAVSEETPYAITGHYAVTTGGRRTYLSVSLQSLGNGFNNKLFENRQDSRSTAGASFTLGETGGDADNLLSGSATGVLLPGQNYFLFYTAFIENFTENLNDGAVAEGQIRMYLGEVPEPASLALLGAGALLLGSAPPRHRRRKRAAPH